MTRVLGTKVQNYRNGDGSKDSMRRVGIKRSRSAPATDMKDSVHPHTTQNPPDAKRTDRRRSKSLRKRRTPHEVLREFTNVIELDKHQIQRIDAIITKRSREISDLILEEGVATMLAYKYAQDMASVFVRDGLNLDPGETDDEVDIIAGMLIKYRVLCYFIDHLTLDEEEIMPLKRKIRDRIFGRKYSVNMSSADIDDASGIVTDTLPNGIQD